jgi:hypothetical protein
MFFGLLCNGTSSLSSVWKEIKDHETFVKEFCSKKHGDGTKIFRLLVLLDKQKRGDNTNKLVGNCKLPRFQFANHGEHVIHGATSIHRTIKDFLQSNMSSKGIPISKPNVMHGQLFKLMNSIKGIGPMNFNQLWHSLCLCGVLPHEHIQASVVGPGTGPAKLIQTFYPKCKLPELLLKRLQSIRTTISDLGLKKVSDFFLENMMCEIWRLGMKSKLVFGKNMTEIQRKAAFTCDQFQEEILLASTSKHPDIYFVNPYTDVYENLFRVIGNELHMRPSTIQEDNSSPITLTCKVTHNINGNGNTDVFWAGGIVTRNKILPSSFFI